MCQTEARSETPVEAQCTKAKHRSERCNVQHGSAQMTRNGTSRAMAPDSRSSSRSRAPLAAASLVICGNSSGSSLDASPAANGIDGAVPAEVDSDSFFRAMLRSDAGGSRAVGRGPGLPRKPVPKNQCRKSGAGYAPAVPETGQSLEVASAEVQRGRPRPEWNSRTSTAGSSQNNSRTASSSSARRSTSSKRQYPPRPEWNSNTEVRPSSAASSSENNSTSATAEVQRSRPRPERNSSTEVRASSAASSSENNSAAAVSSTARRSTSAARPCHPNVSDMEVSAASAASSTEISVQAGASPSTRRSVSATRRCRVRLDWNGEIDWNVNSVSDARSPDNQVSRESPSSAASAGRPAYEDATVQRNRPRPDTKASNDVSAELLSEANSRSTSGHACLSPQSLQSSVTEDKPLQSVSPATERPPSLPLPAPDSAEMSAEATGDAQSEAAHTCTSKSLFVCSLPSVSALLPADVEPTPDVIQDQLRSQADDSLCSLCEDDSAIPQLEGKPQTADLRVWMAALAQQEQKLQKMQRDQKQKLKSTDIDKQVSDLEKGFEKLEEERVELDKERRQVEKQSEALKWFRDEQLQKQRCTLEAEFLKKKDELLQKLELLQKEKDGFVQKGEELLQKGNKLAEERRELQRERDEMRARSDKAQQYVSQRESDFENRELALQQEKTEMEHREKEVAALLETVMAEAQKNDVLSKRKELEQKEQELDCRKAELENEVVEKKKWLQDQIQQATAAPWFWQNQDLKVHGEIMVWLEPNSDHDLGCEIMTWLKNSAIHGACAGRDGNFVPDRVRGVRVLRVENPMLWKAYAAKTEELRSRHKLQKKHCKRIHPAVSEPPSITGSPLSWRYDKSSVGGFLNEVFLWHGTKPHNIDLIARGGFDERVCQLSGMFGAGLYFAQDSCKAGQYATPDTNGSHWFILSRVLLGRPHYTGCALQDIRKAPHDLDSVIYDPAHHAGIGHHRELIVYDRYQAYPEYIVEAYTR